MASLADQIAQNIIPPGYFYSVLLPILAIFVILLIIVGVLIYFMYKRRKEFHYKPGIKAGLIIYLLIFIIHIIFLNIGILITPSGGVVNYGYIFITTFPSEIIKGIFWGAVFVFFYNKLPGSSSIKKAFVLGLISFFILPIVIGIVLIGLYGLLDFSSLYGTGFVLAVVENIVSYFVFGIFLSYFYDRFKKSRPKSAASQSR